MHFYHKQKGFVPCLMAHLAQEAHLLRSLNRLPAHDPPASEFEVLGPRNMTLHLT